MTLDTAAAVGAIAAKTKRRPKIGVILGSGLGGLAKDVQDATRIAYGDIPGFRRSTAPGHAGESQRDSVLQPKVAPSAALPCTHFACRDSTSRRDARK